jgi:hypothetical protein
VQVGLETTEDLGLTCQVLAHRKASDIFGVRVTPFAYVVDKSGVVLSKGVINGRRGLQILWKRAQNYRFVETAAAAPGTNGHSRLLTDVKAEARRS